MADNTHQGSQYDKLIATVRYAIIAVVIGAGVYFLLPRVIDAWNGAGRVPVPIVEGQADKEAGPGKKPAPSEKSAVQGALARAAENKKLADAELANKGISVGGGAEISYPMAYTGALIRGTSTFVFTVEVADVDGSYEGSLFKSKAQVRLLNIRRSWNGNLQEADIRSMPFRDPRFGTNWTYEPPAEWGPRAAVGDLAWVEGKQLTKR